MIGPGPCSDLRGGIRLQGETEITHAVRELDQQIPDTSRVTKSIGQTDQLTRNQNGIWHCSIKGVKSRVACSEKNTEAQILLLTGQKRIPLTVLHAVNKNVMGLTIAFNKEQKRRGQKEIKTHEIKLK